MAMRHTEFHHSSIMPMNHEQVDIKKNSIVKKPNKFNLVLYNDDVNTFEHVITCLVEVCRHTQEQAEQCALIAHYKGKYEIRSGSYKDLLPLKNSLNTRHLTVAIE